jgi:hypothetical protein
VKTDQKKHPSRNLDIRKSGYGIGAGYEKPLTRKPRPDDRTRGLYGAICHGGYYGAGSTGQPFKVGQATFGNEIEWYRKQYGEETAQ